MVSGQTYEQATVVVGNPLKERMAVRLVQRYKVAGEAALQDGRYGHPAKLRGAVRGWLTNYCQNHLTSPSGKVQTLLFEQFKLKVSVSQINRVRAKLGLTYQKASVAPPKLEPPKKKN